jgi:hypothetical protein
VVIVLMGSSSCSRRETRKAVDRDRPPSRWLPRCRPRRSTPFCPRRPRRLVRRHICFVMSRLLLIETEASAACSVARRLSQCLGIAIRRNAKKIATQMTRVPKAQAQLRTGRMATIIAIPAASNIIRTG